MAQIGLGYGPGGMCQVVQEWRQIGGYRRSFTRGLDSPNTMQEYKRDIYIYVFVFLFAKLGPQSDPGSSKPSFVPMVFFSQCFCFFGLLDFCGNYRWW